MTTTTRKLPKTIASNQLPNGQLRIQMGSRIRLSEADRDTLKQAYRNACEAEQPSQSQTQGYVKTTTAWSHPSLNKSLGMDSILFSQIVSSRDPIQLGLLLRIQKALNVEIVSKADLVAVFDSYIKHLETYNNEPTE